MKISLLSRFAENIFWLARYMERAENLARILEVTETHARDGHGNQDWEAILEMNADLDGFRERYKEISASSAARFYILDRDNPTSILSTVLMARENARSLRHVISTEMWTEINILYGRLRDLRARDVAPARLAGLCTMIKESCQTHTGITEGTLYQDEGWNFYWMGKALERADQTSRLIDITVRRAMLSGHDYDSRALDTHWNTMLRSCSGYQAFCRTHRVRMHPDEALEFLLLDRQFPRSIASCLDEAHENLTRLRDLHEIDIERAGHALLDDLRERLLATTLAEVMERGLHAFVDDIQRQLNALTRELGPSVFGHDF